MNTTMLSQASVRQVGVVNTTERTCFLSPEEGVSLAVISLALCILGAAGNLLVCFSILLTPSLQRMSNWFLCSMALSDLLSVTIAAPLFSTLHFASTHSICLTTTKEVFRFVANLSGSVSVAHHCFVSVERYVAIVKPFTYKQILGKTRLTIMFILPWLLPLIYTNLRLFVTKTITSYISALLYFGSCITILVCYSFILHHVHKQQNLIHNKYGMAKRYETVRHDLERRLAVTVAVVILIFNLCWTPLFYFRIRTPNINYGIGYECAQTLALANGVFNPLIYNTRNREFRKAIKKVTCYCCERVARQTRATCKVNAISESYL